MTNEGMELLRKVENLLLNADLHLSLIESEHIAASEIGLSAEVYSMRQEIICLSDKIHECLSEDTKPVTQSEARFYEE